LISEKDTENSFKNTVEQIKLMQTGKDQKKRKWQKNKKRMLNHSKRIFMIQRGRK
jgi:hypothetical protein